MQTTLQPIHGTDNADRAGDVVFIHGLGGHFHDTWTGAGDEGFWPRWLGEDCPDLGIWSVGYAVSPSQWKGQAMPLFDRALNILHLLDVNGLGGRPLCFIAHSMGGLVVKEMLRQASQSAPAYAKFSEVTCAVVFLSTPHAGSGLANLSGYLDFFLRSTVAVKELEADAAQLRSLNLWYRNNADKLGIETRVYYEAFKTRKLRVVTANSADPGITGVVPIPIDADHNTICKPESRRDQVYLGAKSFVREAIRRRQDSSAALLQATRRTLSPHDVALGAAAITTPRLKRILARHATTERPLIEEQIAAFLESTYDVLPLIGPPGTGKTIVLARTARKYIQRGWVVLMAAARTFTLDKAAEQIVRDGLEMAVEPDWRTLFIEPWQGEVAENAPGVVFLLDGMEWAQATLAGDLSELREATQRLPRRKLKLLVTCTSEAWRHQKQALEPWSDIASPTIDIGDFTEAELDQALEAIGIEELSTETAPGDWLDPRVAAMRELLLHPANFGAVAVRAIQEDHGQTIEWDLSWPQMVAQHVEQLLQNAEHLSGVPSLRLRDALISLAGCHTDQSSSRSFDIAQACAALISLQPLRGTYSPHDPLDALLEAQVLQQVNLPDGRLVIEFHSRDVEAYLYSFVLQREMESRPGDDIYTMVLRHLADINCHWPTEYAALLWLARIVGKIRYDTAIMSIVRALVMSEWVVHATVFRLAPPQLVAFLFRALQQADPGEAYAYREALEALRPTPIVTDVVQDHLQAPQPHVRKVAVQLCGSFRHLASVPLLIGRLTDPDEDTRSAAIVALGRMGRSGIPRLVEVASAPTQPTEARTGCLGALREIGVRDGSVTAAIGSCLREGREGDEVLFQAALLAAIHLRAQEHRHFAFEALHSRDGLTALTAARLLDELPEPDMVPHARQALAEWRSRDQEPLQSLVLERLLTALAKSRTVRGIQDAIEAIREGIGQ